MGNLYSYFYENKEQENTENEIKIITLSKREKFNILNYKCFRENRGKNYCKMCLKNTETYYCIACKGHPKYSFCENCMLIHNHYHKLEQKANSFMGNSNDKKVCFNACGNPF